MNINENNFLNLGDILVNEVIGSELLFLALTSLAVIYFGMKYNVPTASLLALANLALGLTLSHALNEFWLAFMILANFGIGYLAWSKRIEL